MFYLQGSSAGRDRGNEGDSAWCPKMRVRNLAVNERIEPRPSRDKKVAAVEMGLKMAAEKRRKSSALAVSPNSLILHSPSSTKTGFKNKGSLIKKRKTQSILPTTQIGGLTGTTSFPSENDTIFSSDIVHTPTVSSVGGNVPSSSTLSKSSGPIKPKKGLLTAKQRLGKILKLKF